MAGIDTAIAGGIALAGVALGNWLNRLHTRQEREVAKRERWRDEAIAVLGALGIWLTDSDPDGLGINVSPQGTPKLLVELRERRDVMRKQLATLAIGYPTDTGRDLAGKLETEIFNASVSTEWFLYDLLKHSDSAEQRQRAKAHHSEAGDLRKALANELQARR